MKCETCNEQSEKRFCSRRCANKYSTQFQNKAKKQGKCKTCNVEITKRNVYCESCRKIRVRVCKKNKEECSRCGNLHTIDDSFFNKKKNRFYSYCKKCAAIQTGERQQTIKQKCLEYKGNKCEKCGYDKCPAALEFHHKDPSKKDFTIARYRRVFNDKIKDELDKCQLLCSNCHREHHYMNHI